LNVRFGSLADIMQSSFEISNQISPSTDYFMSAFGQ